MKKKKERNDIHFSNIWYFLILLLFLVLLSRVAYLALSDEVDEAATAKDSITLIDKSTNINYVIGIINGKLTMEVTE